MKEYQSLCHTRWDCKYHVVFIPKRRKKRIFGALRRQLGEIFHELAAEGIEDRGRRSMQLRIAGSRAGVGDADGKGEQAATEHLKWSR